MTAGLPAATSLSDPAAGSNSLQMSLHLQARASCASDPEHGCRPDNQNGEKQQTRGDEEAVANTSIVNLPPVRIISLDLGLRLRRLEIPDRSHIHFFCW